MKALCCKSPCRATASISPAEELPHTAKRLGAALVADVAHFVRASDQNLGHLEAQVAREAQELLRQAVEAGAQQKADATGLRCPVCQRALTRCRTGQPRTFGTRFGPITVRRTRGYCKRCHQWRVPADFALGLADTAGYSPAVQEMAALLTSKMPVEEASLVLERLTGVQLPRATLDREARRQGERAQTLRRQLDAQATAPPAAPAAQLELPLEPYQLIIQMDAWNIRERDAWGQSAALRRQGQEPERWHWVCTGTVFRLDHRTRTAGGRPVISERGYVATRTGIDGLREQLHAEAQRRGLGQAAGALVIADGAVWLWRLADDRFPQARQRLDFYHAVQHLAAVGRALYGEDKARLKAWLKPLARQVKNHSALKVIRQLEEIQAGRPAGPAATAIAKEVNYFQEHQGRMDYRAGRRAHEPIGSGAVEATCRQMQCRFKRPGQFWSQRGDEALLCLEMFWRNNRWHLLFPHAGRSDLARN